MSSLLPRAALEVRVLGDADRTNLQALLDAAPLVDAVVAARLRDFPSIEPRSFGATMLGVHDDTGTLRAAAFHGGNLLPVGGGPEQWSVLVDYLSVRRRVCTSIVGQIDAVGAFWPRLDPVWGPARAVRTCQPLLTLDDASGLPPAHPGLHAVRRDQAPDYLPAAAAMFTEELGVSPYAAAGAQEYRRRISRLIEAGKAFAIFDDEGSIAFKADIGAVSAHTCQVQGVWVRPDLRRRGLGTAALAGVLRHALTLAPSVSLYVNDYNEPARRAYERLGMREVDALSTVLF